MAKLRSRRTREIYAHRARRVADGYHERVTLCAAGIDSVAGEDTSSIVDAIRAVSCRLRAAARAVIGDRQRGGSPILFTRITVSAP